MRNLICPNVNCGYTGKPARRARGSILVGLVLCCFFLVPGILYFLFRGGYRYSCPKCGVQVGVDA